MPITQYRTVVTSFPIDCGNVSGLGPNTSAFADYVQLPAGGSCTYVDGTGRNQTFTAGGTTGNVLQGPTNAGGGPLYYPTGQGMIRKVVSASAGIAIVGTGTCPVSLAWNPTAVKTAAYSAQAGDLVLVNPDVGGFVVALPSAVGNPGVRVGTASQGASQNQVTYAAHTGETIQIPPRVSNGVQIPGGSAAFQLLGGPGFQASWTSTGTGVWLWGPST